MYLKYIETKYNKLDIYIYIYKLLLRLPILYRLTSVIDI